MSELKPATRAGGMLVLAILVLVAGAAAAEDIAIRPQLLLNAMNNGAAQFQVVSGRIAMACQPGVNMDMRRVVSSRREQLTIRSAGGPVSLKYLMVLPSQQITIDGSGSDEIQIARTPQGDTTIVPVQFVQKLRERLVLTVGAAPSARVYKAADVWHLFVAEPVVCRQHLAPLLEMLEAEGSSPHLGAIATEVEAALLRLPSPVTPDKKRWAALVERLASQRFTEREAAEQELRGLGQAVTSYLDHLDSTRLDAEQRFRVRRILNAAAEKDAENTPEEIAVGLAADPAVWLDLMSRSDAGIRRQAAQWLSALQGEPIGFDPAADASVRAKQIEQLRAKLGAKK
jgi:hypothetical protein